MGKMLHLMIQHTKMILFKQNIKDLFIQTKTFGEMNINLFWNKDQFVLRRRGEAKD